MSITWSLIASLGLLIANAFFVAAEFAVVAARRHRLEERVAAGSRLARAALRSSRELSVMLAGAQLGITLCTLGLGALAKPAVAVLLEGLFGTLGVPDAVATVIAVLLAVSIVVFLHMVVGEMAPKSWAISDAERSAELLAWPFRAFVRVCRPVLAALNGLANGCLRLVGVAPQDELAQVHGPAELRMLLATSHGHGLIQTEEHRILTGALALDERTLRDVAIPFEDVVSVHAEADLDTIEAVSRESGRSRLVVFGADQVPVGLVHVLDAIRARTSAPTATAADLMYPTATLGAGLTLLAAVAVMQRERAQLAFVAAGTEHRPAGAAPVASAAPGGSDVWGIVALEDVLELVLGEFDDERD